MGVENRVSNFADRPADHQPKNTKQVEYIIPLAEILAELHGTKSANGKAVTTQYHEVIDRLGDEFSVLRNVPTATIQAAGFPLLALAITHLRQNDVIREPGYDGIYGTIKVFKTPAERTSTLNQLSLL